MKKPIAALITSLLLSSCLPAVFVAGATAGGVVISDRRTFETMVTDKEIACKALLQLNSDPALKENSHICVISFNRVVLLVGETVNAGLRERAYDAIKDIPGIRRINNEIIITPPLNRKKQSMDAWITTKVKGALIAEKGLNSTQIKVVTEGCTVYLMGLVSHCQAEIAITVTRQVTGVAKVVTLFEYAG